MNKKNKDITYRTIEDDNEDYINELQRSVGELKNITLQINSYVNDEKEVLGKMDNNFGFTNNMMANSIIKIENLLKSKVGKTSCYLALFIVSIFIILYFMR